MSDLATMEEVARAPQEEIKLRRVVCVHGSFKPVSNVSYTDNQPGEIDQVSVQETASVFTLQGREANRDHKSRTEDEKEEKEEVRNRDDHHLLAHFANM